MIQEINFIKNSSQVLIDNFNYVMNYLYFQKYSRQL